MKNMSSLREEIIKYLWNGITYPVAEEKTDVILSMIEKRIDSRIKFINDNNTSDLGKYSVMELELLKKEMLK
jgi:hypothetical protein